MYVYKYDLNNIYTGKETADIDPLESEKQGKNIYLIPANATKTAPKEKSGFANVWTGDAWELVADNRGVKYWPAGARNGDIPQVMAELGPLPDGASMTEPVKTIGELKTAKLAEINSACESILKAATATYPNSEVLTFDQQTAEAVAYLNSGDIKDAPLLSALASGRGIDLHLLAEKVIAKRDSFTVLSGYVIGQRQALEDRLNAAETAEEIASINVIIKTE